jgi:flagellar hook assembly protein FlgD
MLGQQVRTMVDDFQSAGYHQVVWDGRSESGEAVASGIYVYRLTAGNLVESRKMQLMK